MIFEHTLGLFIHPDKEWALIRSKSESPTRLYFQHTILLALIPAVAAYIGSTQTGWSVGGSDTVRLTTASGLSLCVLFYFALLAGVYILGQFIDFMAITYGVNQETRRGVELAAYAGTPMFLAGIVVVFPNVWLVLLVGLAAVAYSVYLLYEGLPILMKIPEDRGFMFASSILTVGLVMLVAMIAASVVIWGLGVGPEYTSRG